jgi:hypothetical protein
MGRRRWGPESCLAVIVIAVAVHAVTVAAVVVVMAVAVLSSPSVFVSLKKKEKKKVSLSFRGVGKCEEKIGKREKERCGVVREWNPTLRSHLGEVRSVQMETKNLSEAEK